MIRSAMARMGASWARSERMLLMIGAVGAQRMRAACFAEAAADGLVVGFQEDQLGIDQACGSARTRPETA